MFYFIFRRSDSLIDRERNVNTRLKERLPFSPSHLLYQIRRGGKRYSNKKHRARLRHKIIEGKRIRKKMQKKREIKLKKRFMLLEEID